MESALGRPCFKATPIPAGGVEITQARFLCPPDGRRRAPASERKRPVHDPYRERKDRMNGT